MKPPQNTLYPWLVLQHSMGEHLAKIDRLLAYFKTAEAILQASPSELKACGLSATLIAQLKNKNEKEIERDLTWQEHPNHFIVPRNDSRYPTLLKEITRAPLLLYVAGNPELLSTLQVAIVGSRKATPIGIENTLYISQQLSRLGLTVTSGLALGIDGAAHQGALRESGKTIAVLGNGLHTCYPERHRSLASAIAKQGAVISEAPLATPPHARLFPKRNRIISGLSLGTVVVEASPKSGSLITARLALEQNREVFAIPGSILSFNAKGTNALIQQGAKLVGSVTDILEEIACLANIQPEKDDAISNNRVELAASAKKLLQGIDFSPTSIEQIAQRTQKTVQEIPSLLLILELHGYIRWVSGLVTRIK